MKRKAYLYLSIASFVLFFHACSITGQEIVADAKSRPSAMLTFSFDDGHISNYTAAFPVLQRNSQVGTLSAVSDWTLADSENRISPAQFRNMQNAGWEIASHSKTHARFNSLPQTYQEAVISGWEKVVEAPHVYTTNYDYALLPYVLQDERALQQKGSLEAVALAAGSYFYNPESSAIYLHTFQSDEPSRYTISTNSAERELQASKAELSAMGLKISSFIIPYSNWLEQRRSIATKYYGSVASAYNHGYMNDIPPSNPYALARRPVYDSTSVEEIESWVTDAIRERKWLILMFHHIDTGENCYSWPKEHLQAFADWVKTQKISVVTIDQGLRGAVTEVAQ